jgi:hypothetical protein
MDFGKILAELRQEKAAIEQAILSIEKLAGAHRRDRIGESHAPGEGQAEEPVRKRGRPKGSKNRTSTPAASAVSGVPSQ